MLTLPAMLRLWLGCVGAAALVGSWLGSLAAHRPHALRHPNHIAANGSGANDCRIVVALCINQGL